MKAILYILRKLT